MNMREIAQPCLWLWLCVLLGGASAASAEEMNARLGIGTEYTTGDYGGTSSVDEIYVPMTGSWDNGLIGLRLSVPWATVRAPEGTLIDGPDGQPVVGDGPQRTESGLGDVIAAVTWIDAVDYAAAGISADLTGTVKFGTADEDKGLGTGENDYSLHADVYKFFGSTTLIISGGHTVRGDPDGYELENVWFASGGVAFRVNDDTRSGIFLDWRQSAVDGSDDPAELSGFLSKELGQSLDLAAYALLGLSDSSPDWGGGLNLNRRF
ncbi:MAG: hypothetical protein WBN78_00815 [Gammaproteobacteria bacterium]